MKRIDMNSNATSRKRFMSNQHDKRTVPERLVGRIEKTKNGCWEYQGHCDASGYGRCWLLGENMAHRASWKAFRGDIPDGKKVLHRCDNPSCINPSHLFLGTQKDNVQDCLNKGRHRAPALSGERNPMSKLTEEKVAEIRLLYSSGDITQAKLAQKFGVGTMTINRVLNGVLWKTI